MSFDYIIVNHEFVANHNRNNRTELIVVVQNTFKCIIFHLVFFVSAYCVVINTSNSFHNSFIVSTALSEIQKKSRLLLIMKVIAAVSVHHCHTSHLISINA